MKLIKYKCNDLIKQNNTKPGLFTLALKMKGIHKYRLDLSESELL